MGRPPEPRLSRHPDPAMRKPTLNCHHYAFISVLLWGTSYILTKLAMESYTAGAMALFRNGVGALVLLAVARHLRLPAPKRRDWPLFLLSGVTGLGLYMYLFSYGTRLTGATTSGILIATAPIMTAVLARVVLRERIAVVGWAAIGLAFSGILVMTLWDGAFNINQGVIWLLTAALSLSVYLLLQRRLSTRHNSIQVTT